MRDFSCFSDTQCVLFSVVQSDELSQNIATLQKAVCTGSAMQTGLYVVESYLQRRNGYVS